MRLELGDGQWADLRERLTYGQAQPIRQVLARADQDREALADLDLILVAGYVSAWHVLDLDGNAVPLDHPELAPDDVIQAIALKAIDLWKGTAGIPKAGTKRSRNTPPALRSA